MGRQKGDHRSLAQSCCTLYGCLFGRQVGERGKGGGKAGLDLRTNLCNEDSVCGVVERGGRYLMEVCLKS